MIFRLFRVVFLFVGFMLEFWWTSLWVRYTASTRQGEIWRALYTRQALRFRSEAIALQGLLVKLGQFLSARVDLLPKEYTSVLEGLQDSVPPVDFSLIRISLEESLGGDISMVFSSIDPVPLGAASLGQVHKAELLDGTVVAVKVQRPGIDRLVETDLIAVRYVVHLLRRFTRFGKIFNLPSVYQEFKRTTLNELDYILEGKNAEEFAVNLAGFGYVRVPKIHWQWTRKHLLIMEYLDGVKASDFARLQELDISRHLVAVRIINAYLKMMMEDGFFHADPHFGNLFAYPDEEIAFIDFGMVGRLEPWLMSEIKKIFLGVSGRRAMDVVEALSRMSFLLPGADKHRVARAIGLIIDRFYGQSLAEIRSINVEGLADEVRELVRNEPIQIPANIAFLGRAVGMLIGVATALDPDLNLVEVFEPYAKKMINKKSGDGNSLLVARGLDIGRSLLDTPELLVSFLQQAERGELRVQTDIGLLVRQQERMNQILTRIGAKLLAAGLFLGAVFLELGHEKIFAVVMFALALYEYLLGGRKKKWR